jgi:uncharacterized membrane protein
MTGKLFIGPVVLAATGLLLHWLPLWRRENHFFGVTTPAGFDRTAEGRNALRWFRIWIWIATALAVLMAAASLRPGWWNFAAVAPLIQSGVAIVAFAAAHRKLRRFAMEPAPRSASLLPERESLPGGMITAIVPLAILASAAIYVSSHWALLPERIPVHWNLAGQPDRWVDRSLRGVLAPLSMGALMWAVLLASALGILKASRRPAGENAEWTRRFRYANLRLLMAVLYVMSLMFAFFAVKPILEAQGVLIPGWLPGLAPVAVIIGFTIPIFRLSAEPGSGSDSTPDECWYWGQIYYNRNDPALMVERRFGVGYTFNFGNRLSWLFLILPAILMISVKWLG